MGVRGEFSQDDSAIRGGTVHMRDFSKENKKEDGAWIVLEENNKSMFVKVSDLQLISVIV